MTYDVSKILDEINAVLDKHGVKLYLGGYDSELVIETGDVRRVVIARLQTRWDTGHLEGLITWLRER